MKESKYEPPTALQIIDFSNIQRYNINEFRTINSKCGKRKPVTCAADEQKKQRQQRFEPIGISFENCLLENVDDMKYVIESILYFPQQLIMLDLRNNKITNLVFMDQLTTVQILNLQNNYISEISSLGPIKHHKELKSLNLIDNPIMQIPNAYDIIVSDMKQLKVFNQIHINDNMRLESTYRITNKLCVSHSSPSLTPLTETRPLSRSKVYLTSTQKQTMLDYKKQILNTKNIYGVDMRNVQSRVYQNRDKFSIYSESKCLINLAKALDIQCYIQLKNERYEKKYIMHKALIEIVQKINTYENKEHILALRILNALSLINLREYSDEEFIYTRKYQTLPEIKEQAQRKIISKLKQGIEVTNEQFNIVQKEVQFYMDEMAALHEVIMRRNDREKAEKEKATAQM